METTIEATRKEKLYQLKNELKKLAKYITELKSHRKQENRGDWSIYALDFKIRSHSHQFRHKHIAYCLERGRPYEVIEPVVREDNKPNWNLIRSVQNEINS